MSKLALLAATAASLVSLNAGTGTQNADPNANPAANPTAVDPKPKVKLTRGQARELAIKLAAKAEGVTPEVMRQRLTGLTAGGNGGGNPANPNPADKPKDLIALETQRKTDFVSLAGIYFAGDSNQASRDVFVLSALKSDWDLPTAKKEALKMLAANNNPIQVHVGEDANLVSLRSSMSDAIRLRAGAKIEKPHERAVKLRGLSLVDMARQYLSAIGHPDAAYLGKSQVIALAVSRRELGQQANGAHMVMLAESIGDFPSILKDAINKQLNQAYRDANPTWNQWARRGTAPDFKQINRANISEVPSLLPRNEGQPLKAVTLSDTNETYFLSEYANKIKLTRRAMINDDLSAFSRIPQGQGNACGRLEEDVAYAQITANPTMVNDGYALFSTQHANYVASGSGAAPSTATLQTGFTKIRLQKGPAGAARLNLEPKFIFVPVALEASTRQLINSNQLLAVVSTTSSAPVTVGNANPFADRLKVISNPRFDDISSVGWYLGAFYGDGQVDTVEVCFLEDEPEPVLKQQTEWDTDDQEFAVRHTVASKVLDFRGLFFNYGS